jgi:anhydro-N-acetylmuramic acid kinase
MRPLTAMGLISGTSMDGIDVAIVEIASAPSADTRPLTLKEFATIPYPQGLRSSLLAALAPDGAPKPPYTVARDLCALNFALGEAFASAACAVGGSPLRGVDVIGSHGQTIYHLPDDDGAPEFTASTLQLGEPAVIAERTGVTCVADFRVSDMAAGGFGAPLVPYLDFVALRDDAETRVALNIGGIANLTLLPAGCTLDDVTAFDIGPGNMLIDLAVAHHTQGRKTYDRDGLIASGASPDSALLAWLGEHPFFSRTAPKTTGRETFGPEYFSSVLARAADLGCDARSMIASLTASAALSIARSIPVGARRIVVSGGGARNPTLMAFLRDALGLRFPEPPMLSRSDDFGLPADAKEAMAFALLAVECLRGRSANVPAATGAGHPAVLGKVVPGRNYASLVKAIAAYLALCAQPKG